MKGSVSHELDTDLTVDELWAVYGTLRFIQVAAELLPDIVQKVSVVHGDGEVGSVIQVDFVPGIPGPPYQKEEFVKVDGENRVKEAKVIEGGFLLLGFQSYLMRFEIIKKDDDSTLVKSTVEYEIDDEHASNASLVTTDLVATIAQVITKHLKEQKSSPPIEHLKTFLISSDSEQGKIK